MREVINKYPRLLHGGDYNPEQWLDSPQVLEEDIRLMKEARVNCVSLGIFHGPGWNLKRGNSISAGFGGLLTNYMKMVFIPFLPLLPAPCPTG